MAHRTYSMQGNLVLDCCQKRQIQLFAKFVFTSTYPCYRTWQVLSLDKRQFGKVTPYSWSTLVILQSTLNMSPTKSLISSKSLQLSSYSSSRAYSVRRSINSCLSICYKRCCQVGLFNRLRQYLLYSATASGKHWLPPTLGSFGLPCSFLLFCFGLCPFV